MAKEDWRNVGEMTTNGWSIEQAMGAEAQGHWAKMKAAYLAYAGAKAEFEAFMQAQVADKLPKESELKFGYMFGKLSVAIGPKREAKAAKAKDEGTLGDWLAGQAQAGQRT